MDRHLYHLQSSQQVSFLSHDGWMDGWMGGRAEGWTDGRTDRWMDG